MSPIHLLLIGAPAAGKGVQSAKIIEKFGLIHVSTGDILRENIRDQTELGLMVKSCLDEGRLVPDDIINRIVIDRLEREDCVRHGWIMDGAIRTRAQAQAMVAAGHAPEVVIHIDVADEVVLQRICGRRTDPVTGAIYNLATNPPTDPEVSARLVQRSDDTVEKMESRLKDFHDQTEPVLNEFSSIVHRIDGTQSIDKVFEDICAILNKQ